MIETTTSEMVKADDLSRIKASISGHHGNLKDEYEYSSDIDGKGMRKNVLERSLE